MKHNGDYSHRDWLAEAALAEEQDAVNQEAREARSGLLSRIGWWLVIAAVAGLCMLPVLLPFFAYAGEGRDFIGSHGRVIETRPLPQRKGSGQCPSGYSQSGDYCAPMGGASRAIPKGEGQCPSGWAQSGSFCREMSR